MTDRTSASTSSLGTTKPVAACSTVSGRPPTSDTTHGVPTPAASAAARQNPSRVLDGASRIELSAINCRTCLRSIAPRNRTYCDIPSARAWPSNWRPSSPWPTSTSSASRRRPRIAASASMARSKPFSRCIRPTQSSVWRGGMARGAANSGSAAIPL